MESINRTAIELVDEAIDFAEELHVGAYELDDEATVLDFGVEFDAGIEAGLLLAEIQTGGLATVSSRVDGVAGAPLPVVDLSTDHPAVALLCSGMAGWELSVDGFEGLASGPARALVGDEPIFDRVGYHDAFDLTVAAVEATELPDESVAAHVAERTGVPESGVHLAAYRTASIVGSVTAAARAAEMAVYRLSELGYDPRDVLTASGVAPVAPVAGDEATAIGRTTDAVAYGGRAHLTVAEPFDRFDEVPSSAGDEYDAPFETVLEDVDWDADALDPGTWGPAQVTANVVGGETEVHGTVHAAPLAESFGL